jgi:hypothetical protein
MEHRKSISIDQYERPIPIRAGAGRRPLSGSPRWTSPLHTRSMAVEMASPPLGKRAAGGGRCHRRLQLDLLEASVQAAGHHQQRSQPATMQAAGHHQQLQQAKGKHRTTARRPPSAAPCRGRPLPDLRLRYSEPSDPPMRGGRRRH